MMSHLWSLSGYRTQKAERLRGKLENYLGQLTLRFLRNLLNYWQNVHTFFKLYPAWKIIGGSRMLKNTSGSNVT